MIGDKFEAFTELKPVDQLKELIIQNNADIYEFKTSQKLQPGTKLLFLRIATNERAVLAEQLKKLTGEDLDGDGHVVDPTAKKKEGGDDKGTSGGDGREKVRT